MLAWVSLSNNPSCIHKHAIGCLHLSSPVCCSCLEIHSNTSSGRILSSANARTTSRYTATPSRYCWKCQEYWSVHTLSSHPDGLASFNALPGHPLEVSSESANTPTLGPNISSALPPSLSLQPARSLHRRKTRHDNIDNLREELHSIQQGITRILNNLQLLSEALLTHQPITQYTSNTDYLVVSSNMDVQLPRPAIEDPGSMAAPPNLRGPNGHGPSELQNISQVTPSGVMGGFSHPNANSQNSNANLYTAPTFSGDFTFAATNDAQLNFQPTQPLTSAVAQPTYAEFAATTQNTTTLDQRQHESALRYWHMHRPSYPQLRTAPVQPPNSILLNGQQFLVQQRPNLQSSGPQNVPIPTYPMTPQASATNTAQASQNASSVGARPAYQGPLYPRPNPYVQFPQSGVSPVIPQYRRHNRTQSSSTNTSPQQHARAGILVGRRRTRPADDPNPHLPRRLSSTQVPRVPATATTAGSGAPPSMEIPRYITYLTPEERLRIQRLAELEALTRSMRSGHPVHGSPSQQSLDDEDLDDVTPPTPKGLDDVKDGRPEPKEDDELTVNLECKICMSQLVDTVMLPCGHAILCRWCAEQHMPSSRADRTTRIKKQAVCPMCRAVVKSKVRIYLS